jgi:ribose 5-phosphate isomerase B
MIYLASDHAGFELKEKIKEYLASLGKEFQDLGPDQLDPEDDFPDYSVPVAKKVAAEGATGILVCGTGQGTALAANKIKGVRAYPAWDEYTAEHARENGDANILALGARTIDEKTAKNLVKIFLETPFSDKEKYVRRVEKIKNLESSF